MGRTPPESVLKALRKEVGFGCPVPGCGSPYLEWHHFDPPWRIKEHHNPEGMIALCSHHHKAADAGAYTNEQLKEFKISAAASMSDRRGKFEWMRRDILAVVGGSFFYETPVIFNFKGTDLIWFERDEDGYMLLNVRMIGKNKKKKALIRNNFWMSSGDEVDLICPPSGKSLRAMYGDKESFSVTFDEIITTDAFNKKYPNVPTYAQHFNFPLTVMEATYHMGAGAPFFENYINAGSLEMHSCLAIRCRTGVRID